jgi:GTP cyclohydrolase III
MIKGELTYKLRLRAALLVGTTIEKRHEISEAVKKLYNLRSSVVHGGVRKPKDALRDPELATRGLEICTQAVRAIVQRNALPDFARWELTGGPCDPEDG